MPKPEKKMHAILILINYIKNLKHGLTKEEAYAIGEVCASDLGKYSYNL